jgi:hypothetical protein
VIHEFLIFGLLYFSIDKKIFSRNILMFISRAQARDLESSACSESLDFLQYLAAQKDLAINICKDLEIQLNEKIIPPYQQVSGCQTSQLHNRTTVGLTLKGATIDGILIGGPAFLCGQLSVGDVIDQVDKKLVTSENLHNLLIGNDLPGSFVTLTVLKPAKASDFDSSAELDNSASSEISVVLERVRIDEVLDHRCLQSMLEGLLVIISRLDFCLVFLDSFFYRNL